MSVLVKVVQILYGAAVGLAIALVMNKWMDRRDEKRLQKLRERTDEAINNALAPVLELDRRRW